MRELKAQERDSIAKRFSAAWEGGDLKVAGKRVAVDVRSLKRHGAGEGKPRLRFDKVATRVMERLRIHVGKNAPAGTSVAVTITAPIRLASKTAAVLEGKIEALLGRGRDYEDTIHGNGVRIRVMRDLSGRAARLIGFVHNSDSDPHLLLNLTRGLIELLSEAAGAGDRWLVVTGAGESSWLETYRSIYAQLGMAGGFQKILMVFGDGTVGVLKE